MQAVHHDLHVPLLVEVLRVEQRVLGHADLPAAAQEGGDVLQLGKGAAGRVDVWNETWLDAVQQFAQENCVGVAGRKGGEGGDNEKADRSFRDRSRDSQCR